ncbi:hypothetical protein PIB30_008404 [Stylosanthes scabra]|uniref:Uncharacterized protein n=1 Tax=Stylosanthes scabra TaxID=79078 RepID=A0ABU6V4A4_9FABA|nr:hypothetical protein [Stylosanthes scabra]
MTKTDLTPEQRFALFELLKGRHAQSPSPMINQVNKCTLKMIGLARCGNGLYIMHSPTASLNFTTMRDIPSARHVSTSSTSIINHFFYNENSENSKTQIVSEF